MRAMTNRRAIVLLCALLRITLPADAQLLDTGIEQGNQHWHSSCGGMQVTTSDAPNGGSDCALAPMISAARPDCDLVDGVEPIIYQELPWLENGDQVTVNFWSKAQPHLLTGPTEFESVLGVGWLTPPYDFSNTMNGPWTSMAGFNTYSTAWSEATVSFSFTGMPAGSVPILYFFGAASSPYEAELLIDNVTVSVAGTGASVSAKAWLDGCYDQAQNLMRDDLRALGLVPSINPYGGSEAVVPSVFATTGGNAIVDWVRLELRLSPTFGGSIAAVRHALIQRDGDIVDVNGVSPVNFSVQQGNYYLTLRHRNHLAVMSADPIALTSASTPFDFRSSATTCFVRTAPNADAPRKVVGSTRTLWSGNVWTDDRLRYVGANNDRDFILIAIGGSNPTATLNGQYRQEDVNMDGVVKYIGAANDRDVILLNIGGSTPTAVRIEQVP